GGVGVRLHACSCDALNSQRGKQVAPACAWPGPGDGHQVGEPGPGELAGSELKPCGCTLAAHAESSALRLPYNSRRDFSSAGGRPAPASSLPSFTSPSSSASRIASAK